ncbi:MAG: CoA transferase [Ruminococcus sp.]|jgi:crotonobetainyl-CoA:carnitine CoA-transferase CaiB-like acyl-CoA transferase|nr:CoA transferase [Ruminococcus sp.]MCI9633919.1 CoA transferase [Ruminococcus sp.]
MLEGMKILSFVQGLAGCSASQILGDLGAEVVRVEWDQEKRKQQGFVFDDENKDLFFRLTGRNQKSAVIDIRTGAGLQIIRGLLEEYNIVLETCLSDPDINTELNYETLSKEHPELIWCRCTCFGKGGPYDGKKADDLMMQSFSGLCSLNGYADKPPIPAGAALTEQHMAAFAAMGIISAAYDRQKSGKGHLVDVNMLSAAMDLQIETFGYYCNGGHFIPRVDTGLSTRIHQSPYGVYATKDGCIVVSLTHYDRCCQIFTPGSMDGLSEEAAMTRREEFDKVVCEEMKKKTTAQWMEVFSGIKDMWYAPVNEYEQVLEDEQVRHNKPFVQIGGEDGETIYALGHANRYDGQQTEIRRLPPAYGQDTEEVLGKTGRPKEHLEKWDDREQSSDPC